MVKWRRKEKRCRNNERYTVVDFFVDLLIFIPELLFLPIRLLFLGMRFVFRLITDF